MPSSPGVPARRGRRAAAVAALTFTGLALASTASAHVTVNPGSLPQGSAAELDFKVPNEESSANTVEFRLQIPTQHPIAQVLAKPVPGWTVSLHTVKLAKPLTTDDGTFATAVSEIDWTGGSIGPGQYQDFQISVDPLPSDTSELDFKAVQTYSNGNVVRWIDLATSSDAAPEHPAPVLTLTPASSAAASSAATSAATAGTSSSASAGSSSASSDTLGVAGLVLGAIGAITGVAALLTARAHRQGGAR